MTFGILLISLAFLATILATAAFWIHHYTGRPAMDRFAKTAFLASAGFITAAIFLMIFLLMTHRFDVGYVYSYTSRMLSPFYLFSALWAGQEGTLLLWIFLGSIFGIILLRQKPENLSTIMGTILTVHIIILFILMEKSPFTMIWQQYENVTVGFMPKDGRGLNPLLINPWMVIHPPVLFLGYVSTEVIFGFALAGLLKKHFLEWFKPAWSWILFSAVILGTGLILGGYWAYATLGWGGFWGWDPVENASFVPWVILVILLHGLIVQKKKNGLVKSNLFFAGLSFILVVYGSFLTRSGVLTDFSVHSFGASDLNFYLAFFLFFYIIWFLVVYFLRFKEINGDKLPKELTNRESFLVLGMLVLFLSALSTFIGMSFPLISSLWNKPTNVPLAFYNIVHLPLGILIALLAALSPVLSWTVKKIYKVSYLFIALAGAVLLTVIGFFLGLNDIRSILLFFITIFMLVVNGLMVVSYLKTKPGKIGGYLTHVGVAFMFIGIIVSSLHSSSQKVNLPLNETIKTKYGMDLTFEGPLAEKDGRHKMKIRVNESGGEWVAKPRFFYSEYNKAYMASPDIEYNLFDDIYIAPIQYQDGGDSHDELVFHRDETKKYGDYNLRFIGFETGDHSTGMAFMVKAVFSVTYTENGKTQTVQVKPVLKTGDQGLIPEGVKVPGSELTLFLTNINADSRQVMIHLSDPGVQIEKKAILSIDISRKPLISFLWLGTLILIIGMTISLFYRLSSAEIES